MQSLWKRRIFLNEPIERFADDHGGVYVVQKNNDIIFIGESQDLINDLLLQLSEMKELKLFFYIRRSLSFNPAAAVNQLLQRYLKIHGRLPELNGKIMINKQFSCN